jgi:hypothetical protein
MNEIRSADADEQAQAIIRYRVVSPIGQWKGTTVSNQFTHVRGRFVVVLAVAAAAALLGIGLPLAGSAHAATAPPPAAAAAATSATQLAEPTSCASHPGDLCIYNNAGYKDGPGLFAGDNANWTQFPHTSCPKGTWNDCVSSLWNNGNVDAVSLYENANYGMPGACWVKGTGASDLNGLDYPGTNINMNDTFSSNYWFANCAS